MTQFLDGLEVALLQAFLFVAAIPAYGLTLRRAELARRRSAPRARVDR